MPILRLTDDQKRKLLDLAASAPELVIHRARLILAYAAGKPTMQAASEAGISRGRARFWKRQFIARGMDIFSLDSSPRVPHAKPPPSVEAGLEEERPSEPAPGDVQEAEVLIEQEIPYPQPRAEIGISVEDTLAEAGRKVWIFHFALMLSHEEGTLLGKDVEELHDMRVATRRMRTAFDVFGQAFEPKIMKQYLKGLRIVGRALGAVRDMDVILQNALAYQKKLNAGDRDGINPLLEAWKKVIERKRSKLIRQLQSDAYHDFKHHFNLFLQSPEHFQSTIEKNEMNPHLCDIVPVLVYGRYAAVRTYESLLPTASMSQLHALRIECKKFRYVLEYFREILGDHIAQSIGELKHIQDHLGELHDTDVACQLVKDFMSDWEETQLSKPILERENPQPIVTYLANLHAERFRLTSAFPELWRKFSRPEFRQNIAQAISLL